MLSILLGTYSFIVHSFLETSSVLIENFLIVLLRTVQKYIVVNILIEIVLVANFQKESLLQ
ncbi:hypothetical protein ATE84_3922 [Aquimarina sp. MAR_2010_214]|nr:hypothetical protein ATE84_3922 [Aquimarina sp. MAR_2010_214]